MGTRVMRKTHAPKLVDGIYVTVPACGRGSGPGSVKKTIESFDDWPDQWKCEYCRKLREKQNA